MVSGVTLYKIIHRFPGVNFCYIILLLSFNNHYAMEIPKKDYALKECKASNRQVNKTAILNIAGVTFKSFIKYFFITLST